MQIDIGPAIRRFVARLLVAGIPLSPLACEDRGGSGGGGGAPCVEFTYTFGPKEVCGGFGDASSSYELPYTAATMDFDPADPRWAANFRTCQASGAPDETRECGDFCKAVAVAKISPGYRTDHQCTLDCKPAKPQLTLTYTGIACGRRPEAFVSRERATAGAATPLGAYLANAAELEAASVPAFRRLAMELALHGAPAALICGAKVALREEVDHWRRTRAVAHAHGGDPVAPEVGRLPPRSLEEMVLENVKEGCVRETYGAALALWQSCRAADSSVRTLMTTIAPDEMRHAELAWRIDGWAKERLAPAARSRRAQVAAQAVQELAASAEVDVDQDLSRQAGLPDRSQAQALLAQAADELWRAETFDA